MAFLSRSILALSMALLSCNAIAQKQCDVELRHGLIITDDVIRIVDKGQTRVQINNNNQHHLKTRDWLNDQMNLDCGNNYPIQNQSTALRHWVLPTSYHCRNYEMHFCIVRSFQL